MAKSENVEQPKPVEPAKEQPKAPEVVKAPEPAKPKAFRLRTPNGEESDIEAPTVEDAIRMARRAAVAQQRG